ncbi:MAG: DnaJ domain-containing protein [Pirellulaceae bacterium]|nr:DnaJ domain-containing protein [Pirellulaceae bacterium]
MNKDLYEILGVERISSTEEIKRAYRKLSMKHHPDHGGDAAIFRDISLAYEVLVDVSRRILYEETGCYDNGKSDIIANTVAQLAVQAFEGNADNPVAWMKDQIDGQRQSHRSDKAKAEGDMEKLSARLKVFVSHNAQTDNSEAFELITGALEGRIEALRAQVAMCNDNIEMGDRILAYLNGISMPGRPVDLGTIGWPGMSDRIGSWRTCTTA